MYFMKFTKNLALVAMFALIATPASAYDLRDARYVTNSKNIDVLEYIVCLHEKNDLQPRGLSEHAALNKAVAACESEKARLPNDPKEPSAAEIKLAILECGFNSGDAKQGMDCGNSSSGAADNAAKKAAKDTGPRLLVAKLLGVRSALELDGAAICIDKSSGLESITTAYFKKNKMTYQIVDLKDVNETRKAYEAGLCDVMVVDGTAAAVELSRLDVPNGHLILPESLGVAATSTPSSVKTPVRPKRPSTTSTNNRKVVANKKTPTRPGRPTATNAQSTKVNTTPRRRTTSKPTRPSQPSKVTSTRSGFPIVAESRGSNIRSLPRVNGKKIGVSQTGQPVTLLENSGNNYKGFPWFKIRMANGTIGYQWGGGLCAKPRTLVSGTKGTCQTKSKTRKKTASTRPTSGNTNSSTPNTRTKRNDAADVIVSVLDLVGKIIDSNNKGENTQSDSSIFTQTLNVVQDGPFVTVSRKVVYDKEAALYTIQGKKGQILNVGVWSPKGNVVFEIYVGQATVGGRTLPEASQDDNAQNFRNVLPQDGQYQILVGSVNGTEEFELSVSLDSPEPPQINTGPVFSGGTVALNRRVVGTYSSKTAKSGNLELNEAANALTWTEFCGPTVVLSVDWTNNLLLPNSGIGAFELRMTNNGKVRGFTYNGNRYTKEASIIMPGCITAPSSKTNNSSTTTSSAIIYWEDNPKDPRANRDYDKVPNAWWGVCEAENYDQNSPSFNNEKAYWDCADEGQIAGGGKLKVPTANNSGPRPFDPRENKDYSAVSDPVENVCSTKFPESLPNDKGYYDCMDVALKAAAKAPKKPNTPQPQIQDPRANKNYNKVAAADSQRCETTYPNSPADDKEFYDCMDAAEAKKMNSLKNAISLSDADALRLYPDLKANDLIGCKADVTSGTMTFKGPGATQYHKCLGMLSVIVGIENSCQSSFARGTKDFQNCMQQGMTGAGNAAPSAPGPSKPLIPDPRADFDYSQVPNADAQKCTAAHPDSPADDKEFYDCMDLALSAMPSSPSGNTQPIAPDPRADNDYSQVPNTAAQTCEAAHPDSPADDKEFYDCMDLALSAMSSSSPSGNTQPIAPDPRENNDYSMVPNAAAETCEAAHPDSPADDKEFYDCMDLALSVMSSSPSSTTQPVAPDPRANNDYSQVPNAAAQKCEAAHPDSPADDKEFFDCMDLADMTAAEEREDERGADQDNGAAPQEAPDPRSTKEYPAVAEDQWNACWAKEASDGQSAVYDCLDAYEAAADNNATNVPADSNQADDNNALAEIQNYCGGNDQCFADLENCYYEYGSLESAAFEQCAADWNPDANSQQSQNTQPSVDIQTDDTSALAEIQNYCGGNDQCFADLENCYYQHGSLESEAFEQCGAAWE